MTYARVANHEPMVFDETRNTLYAEAIAAQVRNDTVVLDLGAGMGIHGLTAAAAGAARVYLVEPQPVINATREVARASGLESRIVVMQGRIEDVELPEPVDLIVSVFTGNLLFTEDLLPSLFHARDRYLKPGGSMLPDRAQLSLAPLNAPALHHQHVARWSQPVMGLDYSAARRFAANEIVPMRRTDLQGTTLLASGQVATDMDLMTATHGNCDAKVACRIETAGLCHGLLGWIRIRLGERWLSTAPGEPEVHWSPLLLPIDPPLPLAEGEEVAMSIRRPERGEWTWSISAAAGSRRHSTFLARTDGAKELAQTSPASAPGLGADGLRTLRTLELLGQGASIMSAAQSLAKTDSMELEAALRQVQKLAGRYGKA